MADASRGTAWALVAAFGAAVGAAGACAAQLLWRSRGLRRGGGARPAVAGVARAQRLRLDARPPRAEAAVAGRLPPLRLDVSLAAAPQRHGGGLPPLVLYVLDPEPVLLAAAAAFVFSQAPYLEVFRNLHVVGVGHAGADFALDPGGFCSEELRRLRRRDFPPRCHPTVQEGRGHPNLDRFVDALADEVVPLAEARLLGLHGRRPRRALLGASYTGSVALSTLLRRPGLFDDLVLGSPSVCFDPEILDEVDRGDWAGVARAAKVGVAIFLGAREREGIANPSNVHDGMVDGAYALAERLRAQGVRVEGVHEVLGEDHSSVKLSLVSRGIGWLAERRGS